MVSLSSSSSKASTSSLRAIRRIMPAQRPHWVGDGFNVFPVFANAAFTEEVSPFLMFDYAAPKQFAATNKKKGVGQHPHRGFETVTLAFQGEVEHKDSSGNHDVIGPGDVQWMTAGKGIIHEEFHSNKFSKSGGTFEFCQLWVNLPKRHKMTKAKYQPIVQGKIPTVSLPLGDSNAGDSCQEEKNGNDLTPVTATARIIAGELGGVKGPATTFSPIEMWDITIPKANHVIDLPFLDGHNCIVFVRRGGIIVVGGSEGEDTKTSETRVGPQAVALMEQNGSIVRMIATSDDTSVLIMGGEPLEEPIAAQGPFVMNTNAEIQQANRDFNNGHFL